MAKNSWRTLDGATIDDLYDAIRSEHRTACERGGNLHAYIGSDSQNIGKKFTSFVQCVAIHIFDDTGTGKGGRVFYIRHIENIHTVRNKRLLREVGISVNLTQKIEQTLVELEIPFEVHLDINSYPGRYNQNKSHEVYDAAMGWVAGMGWEVKCKPDAFVASIIADRHVRGIRKVKPLKKRKVRK